MATQDLTKNLKAKLSVLKTAVTDKAIKTKLDAAFSAAKGNWKETMKALNEADVPEPEIKKIDFAHSLAEVTGDNDKLMGKIIALPAVNSFREFAFTHDKANIEALIKENEIPDEITGKDGEERKKNYAASINKKLFAKEPSAVLHRMVIKSELPISNGVVRDGLSSFFANQPEFNIRTTSIYNAIKQPEAFKGIAEDQREGVINELKSLQRIQAISPAPEVIPHLMDAKLTTAYHVTEMTEKDFMKSLGKKIGEEDAKVVYTNATNIKIRNEQILMSMHEFLKEPHIAAIDRSPTLDGKYALVKQKSDEFQIPINWETLFGSVDFCECGECNSVYSPAAYFVELLQYLRNNNLDPDPLNPQPIKADPKDISGTALEKLFRRRPDLGCLELTCKNTNTVLPYIDLVNEVMESFVVHLGEYHADVNDPKQAKIEHWNIEDETSSELLAQPQHINYDAYCILKKAVYPFTLPYHQPIDATRIFLKFLETSRYELMKTFRSSGILSKNDELPEETSMPAPAPNPDEEELLKLNNKALDIAIDSEFLGITQEEFIILTKQAFWVRKYFEIKCKKNFTEEEYREKIGVKKVFEYYGYSNEAVMLDTNEVGKKGLSFVKKQFLKRTGIQYTELVEILKTKFINPNFPQGKALTILESIKFSYRFLQTLVDTSSTDPKVRFGKLVDFLEKTQPFLPLLDALLHPDPCNQKKIDLCVETKLLKKWVCCYFEKIGKLIVLESGDAPMLSIAGDIGVYNPDGIFSKKGSLANDGTIYDNDGIQIGKVTTDLRVIDLNGNSFNTTASFGTNQVYIVDKKGAKIGSIIGEIIFTKNRLEKPNWFPPKDTCDIEKVRLKHLDGTDVTVEEYDKFHRFIRLWRKLGWTIDETDKAITGLAAYKMEENVELPTDDDCTNCFDEFGNDCECEDENDDWGCGPAKGSMVFYEITPDFLHQLVAVKKLMDSTGIELIKLLTFWTNISIRGEKSLYARLFLSHNMTGIDKVFKADNNGNYLTKDEKISDHIPVLMAAFNLKADDLAEIIKFKNIPDKLTLSNVTVIYRHSQLIRVLHVKSKDIKEIVSLFGEDPFQNADATKRFIRFWEKMEDAGFSYQQLNYVIRNVDDEKKPFAPKKKVTLQLAKTLYDGLNQIDKDHPDLEKIDDETKSGIKAIETDPGVTDAEKLLAKSELLANKATEELIRSKVSLLFDQNTTASIIGLLQGTSAYNTNAPKALVASNDEFVKKFPSATEQDKKETEILSKKIKYDFVNGALQVAGILTNKEKAIASALFNAPDWPKAYDRVEKQALYFFNDVLSGIFQNDLVKAKQVLLQGDINLTADQQDPVNPVNNTAPEKRKYFIELFLPFLREQLTHRFLVDTLAAASAIEKKATDVLISEVLEETTAEGKKKIIDIFRSIKNLPAAGSTGWKGYLLPSKDDNYIFAVISDAIPATIKIDGPDLNFTQQADPSNLWLSDAMKLQAGKYYLFEATGLSSDLKELSWKTSSTPKAAIPTSVLLPDYSAKTVEDSFIKLKKTGMLVSGFILNDEELGYLQKHGGDFSALDFNSISLESWKQLNAYIRFRNTLPQIDTNLLEFFRWTSQTTDATKLSEKIVALTQWKKEDIEKLISPEHFNLNHTEDFKNAKNLLKLQKALYAADKISIDINLLFDWARPSSKFKICHEIAENIRKSIRARYKQEDWEQVVKPLNDELRENQKNALISYLLVQQDLIEWGVVDADSLFEFFLIDVQMDACMETSRIKQAISSVQLFIQRCFLGLEDKYGVPSKILDRDRWDWMSRNVIWQANRKVFLHPENWIEGNLRDDKSSFFKELESELLQKDINKQNVTDALKSYLYKFDEVANMEVVGLYLDGVKTDSKWNKDSKLHVFSRTRNAPYFFYYRYLALDEMNWYPWEKMQIDIPSYDLQESGSQKTIDNGCYLTPVAWNGRLLIFFPQIAKKTKSAAMGDKMTVKNSGGDLEVPITQPPEYFEIKMCWSEYRNGKWTQKQISTDVLYVELDIGLTAAQKAGRAIDKFSFIPKITGGNIIIHVEDQAANPPDKKTFKGFTFSGSIFNRDTETEKIDDYIPSPVNSEFGGPAKFQKVANKVQSLQLNGNVWGNDDASFTTNPNTVTFNYLNAPANNLNFYDKHTPQLLKLINREKVDDLFKYNLEIKDLFGLADANDAFGAYDHDNNPATPPSYHELKRPYSLYNWELFFHTPAMIGDKLSKSQLFEEAMKWYHHIFNPFVDGLEANRAWQFFPFTKVDADNFLETFFNSLKANTADKDINEWRDKPFRPHVVARSRPSAYMKWIVMKYLDNLIAWGDHLFRQDTIESVNYATQLYILAYHILGPRPQLIPRRGKIKPQTYKSLLNKWDAFGNAMVELELALPFSNQTTLPIGISNGVVGMANIFGFATSLYFCIPNNPKLMGYWDTIADRLYKIRHCENIEGVFRKLALWDPPIDPALLVQAVAQGLSIDSVLNDLNTPMPNYRFNYLIQKALELCNELKTMGSSLLSVFEKKDAETLSKMRATHESSIHNLVMKIKKLQLEEAQKSLEGLEQNRIAPAYRLRHYLQMVGEDINKVPGNDSDFTELGNRMETPVDDSGLKLIPFEKEELDKASEAQDWQKGVGILETIASILHIIPSIGVDGKPFGVGVGSVVFAGTMLANAAQAVGKGLQIKVSELSYQSSSAQRKGGYLRQLQDRVLQANLAGYEIKQIDKQIISQKIRISIANQEIDNQQKQIDNAAEVEDFLKNKYTNEELYTWMEGSIKTLYHQVYTLAYDLAKKAEKVYRFERGLSSSNFIQFGYWDASRDGIHSGERLYVGIKQLEAAYQEKRGYDYEITKHISLRQINPLALLELKEKGKCEFELPEVLFDMDYPGHYMRRIRSVSLSIPCIAGPYTSINATLRLLENKFRISSICKDKNDYMENTEEADSRFSTVNIPINSIAASSGQNDSGVFELNFKDERYMPFEGAGCISKWRLEFPAEFRQFDYDTISDAIIHVRYTSVEGGEKLKKFAGESLKNYLKSVEELSQREGIFAIFDLKNDFPNEWYKVTEVAPEGNERVLPLKNLLDRLPVFTKNRPSDKIKATDIVIMTASNLQAAALKLAQDQNEVDFTSGVNIGAMKGFAIRDEELSFEKWELKITDTQTPLEKIWLIIRYILK